ncbi:hypothetical protein [Propionivibrio sp.]|uniref:hypothetical protein n=1 Tax=Propionivibrio sp. TaxID=2212460 RepID=UPI003BF0EAF8
MKTSRLIIALLLLGTFSVGNAWADHRGHRTRFGVVIAPYWGPSYYPPPPYYYSPYYPQYYPPVLVERLAPPVYIEQQPAPAVAPPAPSAPVNYWYYCAAAKGYYPYVKECRSGWQKVFPQPPGQF